MNLKNLVIVCMSITLLVSLVLSACASATPQVPVPSAAPAQPSTTATSAATSAATSVATSKPAATPTSTQKAKAVTLRAVTFTPTNQRTADMFIQWINRVNERAKGELVINLIGGPEAVPAFDQVQAIRNGVIDINMAAGAYYTPIFPEAQAFILSEINIAEQRKSGFADYMRDLHKQKINVYYLGQLRHDAGFYVNPKKPITKPQELAGKKIRSVDMYNAFLVKLGCIPVILPHPDTYAALERNVIDGFCGTISDWLAQKYYEVDKYLINYPLYYTNVATIMNMDKWNSLPKNLQDLLQNTVIEMEPEAVTYYDKVIQSDLQKVKDFGVNFINFSEADAKWYVDTAYQAGWEKFLATCPETGPKLRELSRKK